MCWKEVHHLHFLFLDFITECVMENLFGLCGGSHTGGWDTRLLNAMTNQLPLTDSQKAVSIERVQLLHYSLSLSVPSLLSAAKGDNLEKGNPKDTIIQGYFPLSVFNDLFSRVIPADIEISYNYLIPFPLVICKHKGFLPSKKQEKKADLFLDAHNLAHKPIGTDSAAPSSSNNRDGH